MNQLELDVLAVENFMSYQSFSINLRARGAVAIDGINSLVYSNSNGAGKSAIIEALVWCWFGSLLRGSDSKEDVVNEDAGKNCLVYSKCVRNGKSVEIWRYRQHSQYGNSVRVCIDGQNHTRANARDTDQFILDTLGIDKSVFSSAVVLGKKELANFMESGDAGRKWLFEKLLHLEKLSKAHKIAKDRHNAVAAHISTLQSSLQNLLTERATHQKSLDDTENNRSMHMAGMETRKKELEDRMVVLRGQMDNLTMMRSRVSDLEKKKSEKNAEIDRQVSSMEDNLKNRRVEYGVLDGKISEGSRKIQQMQLLVNQTCTKCDQVVQAEYVQKMVSEREQELSQNRQRLADLGVMISGLQAQVDKARHVATSFCQKVDVSIKQCQDMMLPLSQVEKEIGGCEAQLQAIATAVDPFEPTIAYIRDQLAKDDERIRVRESEVSVAKAEAPYHEFLERTFSRSGVRSLLLDHLLPMINARASAYSSILTDGDLSVEFTTVSEQKSGKVEEEFGVKVKSSVAGPNYKMSSEGEKKRINLCVSLAIHDLIVAQVGQINCVFLDEVFDSLDECGSERVMELINEKTRYSSLESVFVITHLKEVSSLFQRRITVHKQGRISSLCEAN